MRLPEKSILVSEAQDAPLSVQHALDEFIEGFHFNMSTLPEVLSVYLGREQEFDQEDMIEFICSGVAAQIIEILAKKYEMLRIRDLPDEFEIAEIRERIATLLDSRLQAIAHNSLISLFADQAVDEVFNRYGYDLQHGKCARKIHLRASSVQESLFQLYAKPEE